ncbi:HalOD1 output domain-containing protein [Halorientalis brevis]|uniref:HalOD1 output domain-containing protein n=1 Tax=Halorientalis brevis TaxID=1126241 RepID=A0ABD6CFI9_9EURY|nr:HalOD1 output domain-containing protein [Halorientalis brevis]
MAQQPTIAAGDADQPSDLVLSALAAHEDCSALDLDTTLFEVMDPDALDRLFHGFGEPDAHPVSVSFTMLDHEVEVHGDGRVVVDGVQYVRDDAGSSVSRSADV